MYVVSSCEFGYEKSKSKDAKQHKVDKTIENVSRTLHTDI